MPVVLVPSAAWAAQWALHSHAGYRHNRNTLGQRRSLWHISAALWLKPTEALKVVIDRSYDTHPDPSSTTTLRQTVLGIIYSMTPQFDLDASLRRGNDPAIDRAVTQKAHASHALPTGSH